MNSNISPNGSLTSRLYKSEADLHSMLELLMQARSRTNDWHYAHVGELLFNFFMVACHLNPQKHIRLWHDAESMLVAYAILGEDPSFDCQVLPEYEWIGIENEAFDWAEQLVILLRQQDAKLWGGEFVSGSRQDDSSRIQFLEQYGFRYCGRFAELNMLRSLVEPILELKIPAGYQVCSMAEVDHISDRAAAHREVWQPWTVGNISTEDYVSFMQLPGYQRDLDVVTVTPDGVIASFVNGWLDPVNRIGDFGPVGARAAYRQQGLTRLALLEGLRRMRAYGMERVCISTGVSNTAARNLYESIGFRVVNQYLDYVKAG
jgi:ribosomal protein S18 acetylase RimI-like enzyme